ncbi:MAG: hypothetical protein KA004_09840 [Verrucomicrobiales bacterium]|nr:hypothetical protein [Verrucomicrobiales bacterium]
MHVNFAREDAVFPSRWFIGGDLQGKGTFFLGQDSETGRMSGWFIEYGNPEAWAVKADADGNPSLEQTPVSSLVCLPPGAGAMPAPVFTMAGGASFTPDIPIKNSRDGSASVLFLDFRGGSIAIAAWNNGNTITYQAPCFDRTLIEKTFNRVAEYFAPFDVNVTTNPNKYNLPAEGGTGTVGRRMRCIVARYDIGGGKITGGIGGVAHPGNFRDAGTGSVPSNAVCWAFADPPATTADITIVQRLGNSIAHELGHTLGLLHWSTSAYPGGTGEYYPAVDLQFHGPNGSDGWAPLMGDFNYAGLIQWAKGEFTGAETRNGDGPIQDDLAAISTSLSAGGSAYLNDDKGNTRATAATLQVSGVAPNDSGFIGSSADEDYFKLTTIAIGGISLDIKPLTFDSPLDIHAELQDASGNLAIPGAVLTSSALTNSRNAAINVSSLPVGTWYLMVRGNAQNNPQTDGWSRYGSLGNYRITGTIAGAPNPAQITAPDPPPPGSVGVAYNFPLLSTFAPTSYYSTGGSLPPGLGLSNDAVTGIPTQAGVYTVSLAVANAAGGTAKTFTFTIYGSSTLPDALDAFQQDWTSTSPPTSPPSALWQGQRLITNDGIDAARSGSIGANTDSILTADFKGPGTLRFFWRCSAATGDKLILRIDSVDDPNFLTGETSWAQRTINLGNGTHTVSWIYRTDPGTTAGENAGFVDQVNYTQSPQFPAGNFYAAGVIGKPFGWQISATGNPENWQLTGGALPPGLSVSSGASGLGIISGTPTAQGAYDPEISCSNAGGTSTTYPTFHIYPDITLPAALDAAGFNWTTGGFNPWFGDIALTHDGTDAAHSGPIRHGLSTWLQTTVNGTGTLSFWWKSSTELDRDQLVFSIDGVEQGRISGEVDWVQRSYSPGTGTHTLRWEFTRDNGGNGGQNMVWLDQVSWITPGPTITSPLTVNWTCGVVAGVALTADDPNAVWTMSGSLPQGVFFLGNPTNYIGASPFRPGTYSFNLMATNAQSTTTTRAFTMFIESSYAKWARDRGLPPGSEMLDPDKDGILNISECAHALDPLVKNVPYQPVSYDPVAKRLRATFRRRNQYFPDLMYEVQVSANLTDWTTIARSDSGSTPQNLGGALSITETEASPTGQSIYDCVVIDATRQDPGTQKRYMRVKITQM